MGRAPGTRGARPQGHQGQQSRVLLKPIKRNTRENSRRISQARRQMAHGRRQRLGLGTYQQLLQVVSRHRTRIQPQRPNQAAEGPPPRCQARHGVVELAPVQQFRSEVSFLAISPRPLSLCVSFFLPLFSPFRLSTDDCQPTRLPLATCHFLFYASSMFGKRRQLETEAELYDVAVRALMRRAHSVHEMKQKLERRSDNKLLVQVVMARLKENGQ